MESGTSGAAIRPLQLEDVLRLVGVLLVGLAALFLVSTAISRGWIGPELQLLGAALIGGALLGSAVYLADQRRPWAVTLGVGGSAVLATCAGAAYAWLDLIGPVQALGLVAVSAVVSVAVAVRIRAQAIAVAATAAMLLVPPFANIVADSPVLVIGLWLGLFAVAAAVVGVAQQWQTYRVVSTWATAFWVIILAAVLAADDNTDHLVAGSLLVATVGVVLWLGPMLNERLLAASTVVGAGVAAPQRQLLAFEHRLVAAIPLWAWQTVVLLGGVTIDPDGVVLAMAMAAGFVVAAIGARSASRISEIGFASHLLGAGLLVTVGLLEWLDGPILLVGLGAQAMITLIIAYYFDDLFLKINGVVLAGLVWVLVIVDMGEVVETALDGGAGASVGAHIARAVTVGLLAASAWLVAKHSTDEVAELVAGVAWSALLLFPVSLIAPVVEDRQWLVVGVVASLLSLGASRKLGRLVLVIGAAIGGIAVLPTAVGILEATIVGLEGDAVTLSDHLSHLSVVVALGLVTAAAWSLERASIFDGDADAARRTASLGSPLFVTTWVFALGWLASVLVGVPQAQVAISAVWAVAAVGAIVVSLRIWKPEVRYVGMATLGVVLVKLLTVDLAEVETLWRVGLFLIIGLGLLRLGYVLPSLTARYAPADPAATTPLSQPDGDRAG